MFCPDLITGRPLLNGRSGTFLIWAIVCPASVRAAAGFLPLIIFRSERTKAKRVTVFYSAA